jgi:hypothetical protein
MPSSDGGVALEQLVEECRAQAALHPDVDIEVEQEAIVALVRMTDAAHPGRRATASVSLSGWIELSIDGGFGVFQTDYDATLEEYRAYLDDYVQLGVTYLRHGAEERRSRVFGIPMRVLDPDRGWPGIAQLTSTDQVRYVWRRLWRR